MVKKFNIREHIQLHMVTSGEKQLGWIHTHGMDKLGLPELEIRDTPLFLGEDAARLLNHVAQYMYDGKNGIGGAKPVKLGERFGVSPGCRFQFVKKEPIVGAEAHFQVERWLLSDAPMHSHCETPGCSCGS